MNKTIAVLLLVLTFNFATYTSATKGVDTKSSASGVTEASKPPSAAAMEFLRARCNTVPLISSYCYESLLPHAESFQGSNIKLARTATTIFVIQLRASLHEMRRSNSTTPDDNTSACIEYIQEATHGDKEALASFSRLTTGEKMSKEDLEHVKKWIGNAEGDIDSCTMNLRDDGPSLPLTNQHLSQSHYVAKNFVDAIVV